MKVKITIPTKQGDISLSQFQEFAKISDNNDDIFIHQKMIELFCNVKLSHVNLLNYSDVLETCEGISTLIAERPKHQLRFKIQGVEFGMIPNLENMSFGEYVDLDTYLGDWDNMHKAMAVLYRPITGGYKDLYEIAPYLGKEENSELMKHLPLDIVMGAMVFFYHLGQELLKASQSYLSSQTVATVIATENSLVKNTDGMDQFILSLEEMLTKLTELLNMD